MVDIKTELDRKLIEESFSSRRPKLLNNCKTTFKQLKDAFTSLLSNGMLKFTKNVPKADVYLTTTDGNWFVSSYLRPKQKYPIGNAMKLRECDTDDKRAMAECALNDVVKCLKSIDPVLLNRFFANGSNKLLLSLAFHPCGCQLDGKSKCFIEFKGLDSFSNGKKVGSDEKSGVELYKTLHSSPFLADEFAEITPEQLIAVKRCANGESALGKATKQLAKLVDGLGWNSTVEDYIEDRYSRYLVNKALEHRIDISKNGQLANELVARLSGISDVFPTKSDIATFAKREKIDIRSDAYKAFLDDIESNAADTSASIVSPLEKTVYYVVANAANNILCYAALDQSKDAKKLAREVASELFSIAQSIEDCTFSRDGIDALKKAASKICRYAEVAPRDVIVMNGGTPYRVECALDEAEKIKELVG